MNDVRNRLGEITREIVDPRQPLHALAPKTGELCTLMEDLADYRIDTRCDITVGETSTRAGLAISPTQAAMCARETARTVAFIRGAHQAIEHASRDLRRPVQVLYAGCGPFALLAVPLMSLVPPDVAQFTLIDIHQPSIDSARTIVDALGFGEHVTGYVHDDACNYRIADRQCPNIILSETMNVCLAKEPLVTIACRLLSQAPTAILLPSRVFIDLCLVDPSREFAFVESDHVGELPVPRRDRLFLGRVFELNARNAINWASLEEQIPAESLTVPSLQDSRYQPMLLTTVVVYGDTILKDYDSSLTCPQPFSAGKPLVGGAVLDFHYRLGTEPRLVW